MQNTCHQPTHPQRDSKSISGKLLFYLTLFPPRLLSRKQGLLQRKKQHVEVWSNKQKLKKEKAAELSLKRQMQLDLDLKGPWKYCSANWGIFASDRPDVNLLQTQRLPLSPFESLSVVAEGEVVSRFKVEWEDPGIVPDSNKGPLFVCRVNDKWHFLAAGEELEAVQGDRFRVEGIWESREDEVLNIKGYVSHPGKNDGQDKGQELILDPGVFLDRYLLSSSGQGTWRFEADRETPGSRGERMIVRVVPRKLEALSLGTDKHPKVLLPIFKNKSYELKSGEYKLNDICSNGPKEQVQVLADGWPLDWGDKITLPANGKIKLEFYQSTTFIPLAEIYLLARENNG